jgi:protein O-GlcNAc transferase
MLRVLRRFPRAYFGLRDDDMVFLCGQSLFKYLPEDDVTIARIAHRVPNARFVFHGHDDHKRELLENRLDRAFGATGLRREDFCIVLPALPHWHYAELQAMGDIALDPFGVSGCNTTINTLKLGIPVVTLPGKFHRNRQSMGLLTACGLTELIAESPDDFVAIAARLGTDRDARHAVMARIRASMRAPGWTDHSYVSALDDFLARAEPTS